MPFESDKKLSGITLQVYLYVVRKNRPVGPRDVMKGLNLSSPSVSYRHLQKLEDLGYLKNNRYGEYVTGDRAKVDGYLWLGYRLIPKMALYSFIFMIILVVEILVLVVHYSVEDYSFKVFFLLLTLITGFAMLVFLFEGFSNSKRTKKGFIVN